jgi:phosphoglycerol transferase MdoB-like AlkP superfamily enzyme
MSVSAVLRPWFWVLGLALLLIATTTAMDGAQGLALSGIGVVRLVANALPVLAVTALLWGLTRRPLWSTAVALGLESLLYAASAIKAHAVGEPLTPADVHMLGQLSAGHELFAQYVPHLGWVIAGVIGAAGVLVLGWRWERPRPPQAHTTAWRWTAGSLAVLFLGLVVVAKPPASWLYQGQRLGFEPWSASHTRQWDGLVTMLALFQAQARHGNPHAHPAAARAFVAQHPDPPSTGAHPLPDIVIVQSESLFDPGILAHTVPGLPNVDRLEAQGEHGPLRVPTFGGGTIRTEFEVLTGLPLRMLGQSVTYPYLQMGRRPLPGLISALDQAGYHTWALHGNEAAFWSRTSAFKELGFQSFVDLSQFAANHRTTDGTYLTDQAMTDELLARLPDQGSPQAVLAISIEAHGPYTGAVTDPAARDQIPVPAGLTPDETQQFRTYRYHTLHADAQLGRLADALARRSRPTLLIVYGDHLPGLLPFYHQVGFADGQDALAQSPPYLIVALGPQAPVVPHEEEPLPAWGLPGEILHLAGVHTSPYLNLVAQVAPPLAAFNRPPELPPAALSPAQQTLAQGLSEVARMRWNRQDATLWPTASPDRLAP